MDLGVGELLIIAFIVVLLFGSKKLPGAAKSIGQSLRIFKDETKGLRSNDSGEDKQAAQPPAALPPAAASPVSPNAASSSSASESDAPLSTPQS